jgi:hypothetical protein
MMTVDVRQRKAIEIADRFRIVESGGKWIVPSQNINNKKYAVKISEHGGQCDCPDFELRRQACKHVLAVRYVMQRELNFDGTRTTETVTETLEVIKRTTYPQVWPAYNTAQTTEKDHFQMLLHDLCSGIEEPIQTNGRLRIRSFAQHSKSIRASVPAVLCLTCAKRMSADMSQKSRISIPF